MRLYIRTLDDKSRCDSVGLRPNLYGRGAGITLGTSNVRADTFVHREKDSSAIYQRFQC